MVATAFVVLAIIQKATVIKFLKYNAVTFYVNFVKRSSHGLILVLF
jgi:hypothetical protein